MRIGFDLGEVLAGFFESFLDYHSRYYGSTLRREEMDNYDLSRLLKINHELLNTRAEHFYNSLEFEDIQPIKGAVKSLSELKHGNELFVIANGPRRFEGRTRDWIEKYFPKMFKEVYFSDSHTVYPNKMDKGKYCRELELKFFVEDKLEYAIQCAGNSTKVLLFDSPWNKCEIGFGGKNGLIRVFSWQDILNLIKSVDIS